MFPRTYPWHFPIFTPHCLISSTLMLYICRWFPTYSPDFYNEPISFHCLIPLTCNGDDSNSACPDFIRSFNNCFLSIYHEPILDAGDTVVIKHPVSPASEVYINKQAWGGGKCIRKIKAGKEKKGCWSQGRGRRCVVLFVVVRKGPSDKLAFE